MSTQDNITTKTWNLIQPQNHERLKKPGSGLRSFFRDFVSWELKMGRDYKRTIVKKKKNGPISNKTSMDNEIIKNYKNLIKYCYEILKHQRHGQHLFLNIRDKAKYFVDISGITRREILLFGEDDELFISKSKIQNEIFEKIRRIYDNYTNNPYELEIIYCYLFIFGKTNEGKQIFAPLFTVPAELKYDENKGSFAISLTSDELRLNLFVLVDLYPEKESALMSRTGGIKCPELPLNLESVNQVLRKIADLHPAIRCKPIDTPDYSSSLNDLEVDKFTIYISGGIALTKKDNVYLINDLRALLELENIDISPSVLKRFTNKNNSGNNNYILGKPWKTLLTPFAANSAQIKVIKELENNQLLHVQGPPGTGKSQTIANLVCHLVANGHTVLVTSQKNKALEVVSEMLDRLKIKYLYMQLLKDDKESKKKIKEVINELLSEILQYDPKTLKDYMRDLEVLLDKADEELSKLHKEFIQAQKFESAKIDELDLTIGEVYSRYEKLKSFDIFEGDEFIPFSEKSSAKDNLYNYLNELEKIASDYFVLEKLLDTENVPKSLSEIEQFLEDLDEMRLKFEQEISFILPEEVNDLIKILPCFQFLDSAKLQELNLEINKIKKKIEQYISYLSLIDECNNYFLGRIINTLWRKPKFSIIREKLRPQLNRTFGTWLNINRCIPENKNEILSKIDKVFSTIKVLTIRKRIESLIDKLDLSVTNDVIFCQNEHCGRKLRIPLDKGKIKIKCPKCKKEFYFCPDDIKDDMITFNQLKYNLFHSYINKDFAYFDKVFERTKYLFEILPVFLNILEIERNIKDYRQTVIKIRNEVLFDNSKFKFFRENLEKITECGILRRIVKDADRKFRSTEIIAEEIRKINEDKNKFIKNLIDTAIKYNLREKLDKSSIRNDLSYFARILQRSKKRYATFEELKNDPNFDFKEILSSIPCWIMSIHDVARVFPLIAGLFDIVIIDESSQCAIPSAVPILYRGKKAVIVGDDKQLPNVEMQYVDDQFNQSLIRECQIYNLPRSQSFDCKANSLFDLCANFADKHIFLNEHFRCYPEIIRFCNEKFYNNRLLLAKSSLSNSLGKILNIEVIDGAYDDETLCVNKKEAEVVVKKLKTLIAMPKYQNLTFGVMSIFREQIEYIKDLIYTPGTEFYIEPGTRQKFKLIVETADGFQGDERDIILYSFRFAPNSSPHILAHTRREEDYKRLNVAFSRARCQIFCIISLPPQDFPRGILRDYLEYVQNPKSLDIEYQPWDSEFKKEVQSEIEKFGFKVYPQFKTCGFKIDLVVTCDQGLVLAVECDGWEIHYDEYGRLRVEDIERQQILERAGWKVIRITSRDFYRNREKAIEPVCKFFEK